MNSIEPQAAAEIAERHDPYAALRFRDFRLLVSGTFLMVVSEQMLGVAVGWELYERTRAPLALGLIGLVQVLPVVLLALPAGHVADRFDRKWIVVATMLLAALCALGLAALSSTTGSLVLIYACLLGIGIARAFQSPATASLMAQVIPQEHYTNAVTWESGVWQASGILGPALGGLVIAVQGHAALAYALVAGGLLLVPLLVALMRQ